MKDKIFELANVLEGIERKYSHDLYASIIAGAYALWLGKGKRVVDIEDLSAFLEENEDNEIIRLFLLEQLEGHWNEYRRHITAFTSEQLKEIILSYNKDFDCRRAPCFSAPEKLHELIIELLDIKDDEYVADMRAGFGDFLKKVHFARPGAKLWGNEIATNAALIAMIRGKFLDGKLTIVQEGMLAFQDNMEKFDKIFCFPPWGLRTGRIPGVDDFLAKQPPALPVLKGTVSSEWIFALRMLSSLKENGKAALLMTNGGTFNLLDVAIRKYFVERGMISAVIAMPGRLFNFCGLASTIIIFGGSNTHIQMVDATKLGNKGRRGVELTCADISRIVQAVSNNDSEIAKQISNDEILSNDSVLNPGRYLQGSFKFKNGVPFGSVIRTISRGVLLSGPALDQLESKSPTNFQYLTLSDIRGGLIDDDLLYLSEIEPRWEKFCLQPNDLILSKLGYPFKVAVAAETKQKIVVSGNLFIIRLDETLADPYYIKAFLESETGFTLLKSIVVGSAIPNLSADAIKKLQIELPPLEKQKEIAARYKAKLNEIVQLKRKLAEAIESLSQTFNHSEE